jgi:nucleoside-diphosphate-sugar epimerase
MAPRNILITGATGQQGRALIAALRPEPDSEPKFHVLALTRSLTGAAAKALTLERHVTVVEGNMMSVDSTRKVFEDAKETGGVWGVFCVIAFPGLGAKADGEEHQGKASALYVYVSHSPLITPFRR